MKIRVAKNLTLGEEYVTSTNAILARKKRSGKTYLAQKIAEGLLHAKQQKVVVLDLTSAWWGLRSLGRWRVSRLSDHDIRRSPWRSAT